MLPVVVADWPFEYDLGLPNVGRGFCLLRKLVTVQSSRGLSFSKPGSLSLLKGTCLYSYVKLFVDV